MSKNSTRYFVVHSPDGRILAAAPMDAATTKSGAQLRWRPLPGPNHVVSEIELAEEHVALIKNRALLELYVDSSSGAPQLRRRSKK